MDLGSRRGLAAGAVAWAGAGLAQAIPVAPGDGTLAASLVLALVLACLRVRRGADPSLAALLALGLGMALVALPQRGTEGAPVWRVTATIRDVEPRPGALRLGVFVARDPLYRIDVPITGDARLDATLSRLVPGATVVGPVERYGSEGEGGRVPAAALFEVTPPTTPLARARAWPARLRLAFRARAVARLAPDGAPAEPAGIAVALLTGMRSFLPVELQGSIRRSGLAHLFVVSGMHVGWIVLGVTGAARRLAGNESRASRLATLSAIGLAAMLLPGSAPVRRALVALLVVQVAALLGRRTPGSVALAGAAIVALSTEPALALSWSFALTVTATAALVLASRVVGRSRRVVALVAAPAAATWPLVVLMTARAAPWGALATLAALPLVALTLAAGWLALLVPSFERLESTTRGWALGLAACLADLVAGVAHLPGSGAIAASCGPVWAALMLVALFLALSGRSRERRCAGIAVTVCAALWPLRPAGGVDVAAELRVVDVGQGQAVLLRAGRSAVLVDAADDRRREGTRALIARLASLGVRRLDALVLSHPDRDHAGGAVEILAAAPPRELVVPSATLDHVSLRPALASAARRGVPTRPLSAGEVVEYGPLRITAWHPRPLETLSGNEASLVLHAALPGFAALLPGDAGHAAERIVIRGRGRPRVDVLVAGHHGSRSATGNALLAAIEPRAALVSCAADGRFGHPHGETLARLESHRVRTFVTAWGGEIVARLVEGRLVVHQPREP